MKKDEDGGVRRTTRTTKGGDRKDGGAVTIS